MPYVITVKSQQHDADAHSFSQRYLRFARSRVKHFVASGIGLAAGGSLVLWLALAPGVNILAAGVAGVFIVASAAILTAILTWAIVEGLMSASMLLLEMLLDKPLTVLITAEVSPSEPSPELTDESTQKAVGERLASAPLESVSPPAVPVENASALSLPEPAVVSNATSSLSQLGTFASVGSVASGMMSDQVCLKDGNQVSKGKIDAIHAQLNQFISKGLSAGKIEALSYLLTVCSESSKDQRKFYLTIHAAELSVFRAKDEAEDKQGPLIFSNNTIDDETCSVIRHSLSVNGEKAVIEDPVSVSPKYKQ